MNHKIKINRKIIKQAKKEFFFKYLSSALIRLMVLIIPILFSKAIDNISEGAYKKAIFFVIINIIIIIGQRCAEIYNTYLWHKLYNKLYDKYTELAMQSTYNNSLFSLSRISNSEFINIVNNDINIMAEFFGNFVTRSVRMVEFIVIFVYFYLINLYVGLAGTLVSIVAFLILLLSRKKIEKVNIQKSSELDRKTNVMTEFFLGIKEIKNFNIFKQIKSRGKNYTKNYYNAVLTQRVVEDSFKFSLTLLIDLFQLGIVIYGIILISKGQMTIGTLLIIYNYFSRLIENFTEFTTFMINYRQFKVARTRYYKLIEYSQNKDENNHYYNNDLKSAIEFKNVLYGYRDNPTLNNVSFKIDPNSITAITGKSGSGKSGIFELLLKLNRQHEGQILIDNLNINEYDNDFYFNNICLVSKDPTFFNMSIRDNLNIINGDFSKVVRICKQLQIHEEIMQLNDGYDTIISTTGAPLSNTLKYFLGIARVLVRDSKIMLFDEAFDTFDKETRLKLINLLQIYKKLHTLIIITKEPDILEIADQIILIDKNKVVKTGQHTTLKSNVIYQSIIKK